ncbi:MAG: integrin alpha [Myxococcota bacterium]|nr:integrin alpha [Myxococcota bacterium]
MVEPGLGIDRVDTKLIGASASDTAGTCVSTAGDVNADGFDDILMGAYRENTGATDAGAVYLVLGGP